LERVGSGRHQFVALELRKSWVAKWLPTGTTAVRGTVREFLKPNGSGQSTACAAAMSETLAAVARQLLHPPGMPGAWACWHHGKALEVAAHGLFAPEEEFFCRRTRRIASERVVRVRDLLAADLEHPPALGELGKLVGCSPFYLSRVFRDETGQTISQFLRGARLARAAEMLRGGEGNVTEAAMAVGYSSLSHFSKAFAKEFGCCPCFYGTKA
jgi:AraC-like DNA-binding protein